MEVLTQGIATSARERKMAAGDSKAQTASMLQAFGRERTAMAKDLKSGFVADCVSRSANVHTILANTGTMRDGFRQDHVRMQRSLRRRLVQSTEAVANSVASLRADFAKGRADFTKAHSHMTKAPRAGLAKDRRGRSGEVAELINNLQVSRGEMADELTENLKAFTGTIRSHVSGLLADACRSRKQSGRDTARELARAISAIRHRTGELAEQARDLTTGFGRARGEMAEQLRNRLVSSVRERGSEMNGLLERFSESRRALQEDIQAAHQIWSSLSAAEAGGWVALAPRADPSRNAAEIERAKVEEDRKANKERAAAEAARRREAEEKRRAEAEADRQRKAEEKKQAKEAWAKMSDEEKILHVIQMHPSGISASQIGEVVDLHASVVGRTATELVERGEVGKNESTRLYFPLESK
jgi:sRNA-binding protein